MSEEIGIYVIAHCKAELYGFLGELRDTGYPFAFLVLLAPFDCQDLKDIFATNQKVHFRRVSFVISAQNVIDSTHIGPTLLVYQSEHISWKTLFADLLKLSREEHVCFPLMNACLLQKGFWKKKQLYFCQPQDLYIKSISKNALLRRGELFADEIFSLTGNYFISAFSSHCFAIAFGSWLDRYHFRWSFSFHILKSGFTYFNKKTILKAIIVASALVFRNYFSSKKDNRDNFKELLQDHFLSKSKSSQDLVVFLHRLGLDGATNIVYQVLKQDSFRKKLNSIIIISPFEGPMTHFFSEVGVKIEIISYKSTPWAQNCQMLHRIERILDECELIWINTIDHPAHVVDIVRKSGKKTFLFGHESLRENSPVLKNIGFSEAKLEALKELLKNHKNTAAFCSSSTVQYAKEKLGSGKIQRIPGAISRPTRCDLARYYNLNRVDFLVTGWVGERKNQASVIPVFKRLEKLYPYAKGFRDYTLTFVGSPYELPEYKILIDESLKQLPSEKLCFFPMVTHTLMQSLLSRYHVVLIPSLGEALCLTALEMMATGGVLMHSDCEGSEDLIDHGRTGFLFQRENPDSLLKLLLEVLDPKIISDQDFQSIGEEAYKKSSNFEESDLSHKVYRALTRSVSSQDNLALI